MLEQRRLLLALGAAAGGLAAAAFVPTGVASATPDPCDLGDCTMVSGGPPTDVVYQGFRPLVDDWKDNQLANVVVTENGTSFVSGSYNVTEQDFSSPAMDNAIYQFGNFTPAADNPNGTDLDGLSGATVYDYTIGPGAQTVDGQTIYDANIFNVFLADGNHIEIDTIPGQLTNFLDCTSIGCGDWTEAWGSTTPQLLYDSLITAQFPTEVFNIANYLPPDAWFPDVYSMFPPGLT